MKMHSKSLVQLIQKHIDTSKPFTGIEVGVWQGENAKELLKWFENLSPLYLVDRYQQLSESEKAHDNRMGARSQEEFDQAWKDCLANIEFAKSRAMLYVMTSLEAAGRLFENQLDFAFIDSMHDYESVKTDLALWYPKVKSGGLFSGHDYGGRGDKIGIFGVQKAVDEFAGQYGLSVSREAGNVWWTLKN